MRGDGGWVLYPAWGELVSRRASAVVLPHPEVPSPGSLVYPVSAMRPVRDLQEGVSDPRGVPLTERPSHASLKDT